MADYIVTLQVVVKNVDAASYFHEEPDTFIIENACNDLEVISVRKVSDVT